MDQILNTMKYNFIITEKPIMFGEENVAVGAPPPNPGVLLESSVNLL